MFRYISVLATWLQYKYPKSKSSSPKVFHNSLTAKVYYNMYLQFTRERGEQEKGGGEKITFEYIILESV